MDKFLERHTVPKLPLEEEENLSSHTSIESQVWRCTAVIPAALEVEKVQALIR
jgi:hypothetical protein